VGPDNPNVISNVEDPNYPNLQGKAEDVVMKGDPANFTTIVPTRRADAASTFAPAGRRTQSKDKGLK